MSDGADEGFLPPEPPGPEPELGPRPRSSTRGSGQWAPPDGAAQPAPGQGPPPGAPFHDAPPQGWQPPAAGWMPPPPPGQWQQPPGAGWGSPPPTWSYPHEPDNGSAVTGFVLAMVSLGLWIVSLGLSSLLSLGLAIGGLIASRKGKRKLASGETRKHRGLAQAGFVTNIVMIVLASLSTILWAVVWIVYATDEQFRDDLNDGSGDPFGDDSISAAARVGATAVRVAAGLLS